MGFRDSTEVVKYIGGIFETAFEDAEIGPNWSPAVWSSRSTSPIRGAIVVVDAVNKKVYDAFEGEPEPMATMKMPADTGNAYWQGKNLPLAMARRSPLRATWRAC